MFTLVGTVFLDRRDKLCSLRMLCPNCFENPVECGISAMLVINVYRS